MKHLFQLGWLENHFHKGIEVGHIFKLGLKYSKPMNATFLDQNGKEQFFIMGCYGIGTSRTVAASIEQNHDPSGIIWPLSIAPFQIYLLPINYKDERLRKVTDDLAAELEKLGLEVLLDDREDRPGVKFKDADLIGIPLRILVGDKTLAKDSVEFKLRNQDKKELVLISKAAMAAKELILAQLEAISQKTDRIATQASKL